MIRKATKEDVACIAEMASMMWDSHLEELIEEFGAVLANEECVIYLYFREATSQVDMLACTFGDCREGQISRSLLRWKFDAPSACCGVFDCTDNMPIGFAQCGLRHDYVEGTENSPVGYLEGIFIREDYRRKGYAKDLLVECEKWAKQKGCSEFASDCELDNDVSLAFHINMGFIEVNRIICFTKQI